MAETFIDDKKIDNKINNHIGMQNDGITLNEDIGEITDDINQNNLELKNDDIIKNDTDKLAFIEDVMPEEIEQSLLGENKNHQPAKIIADFVFLLGRITTQAIFNLEGRIIIPKNTVVTAKTVLTAFDNGRLLELTRYSKN